MVFRQVKSIVLHKLQESCASDGSQRMDGMSEWLLHELNEMRSSCSHHRFYFYFLGQMDLCIYQKLAWESVVGSLCSGSESQLYVQMCFYQCCRHHYVDMLIPPWVKVLLYTVYTVDCPWVLEFSLQWMKLLPAEGCVWFRFWSTTSTSFWGKLEAIIIKPLRYTVICGTEGLGINYHWLQVLLIFRKQWHSEVPLHTVCFRNWALRCTL